MMLFDLRPRAFDQRSVLHTRRTRRDARQAPETRVEMLRERIAEVGASLERRLHQVDPSSRRVHLLAPQGIRRARRQAEPAVNAGVDQLTLRDVGTAET